MDRKKVVDVKSTLLPEDVRVSKSENDLLVKLRSCNSPVQGTCKAIRERRRLVPILMHALDGTYYSWSAA